MRIDIDTARTKPFAINLKRMGPHSSTSCASLAALVQPAYFTSECCSSSEHAVLPGAGVLIVLTFACVYGYLYRERGSPMTWPEAFLGAFIVVAAVLFFGFITDAIKINIGGR